MIYVYFYSIYTENGGFGHRYKLLLLFFDSRGVLTNFTAAEDGRVSQNHYR